jgi:hypothetical protein
LKIPIESLNTYFFYYWVLLIKTLDCYFGLPIFTWRYGLPSLGSSIFFMLALGVFPCIYFIIIYFIIKLVATNATFLQCLRSKIKVFAEWACKEKWLNGWPNLPRKCHMIMGDLPFSKLVYFASNLPILKKKMVYFYGWLAPFWNSKTSLFS